MKAETIQKGLWYKVYSDDGEYLGQVMQKLGSLNRPLGRWAFGVKDAPVSFGHNFKSLKDAAIALQKKVHNVTVS